MKQVKIRRRLRRILAKAFPGGLFIPSGRKPPKNEKSPGFRGARVFQPFPDLGQGKRRQVGEPCLRGGF
jgi:hypothetical protein